MIVVSDASPIISLAAVKQLTLVQQLYERIVIPEAVHNEIAVTGHGEAGATEVQTLKWIETRKVTDRTLVALLEMDLDRGEAEAIALAAELQADLLLLDERRGRRVASHLGVKHIGLLGIIIEAKHRSFVPAVKPLFEALTAKAGFWMTAELRAHVLEIAGEQ